jgi:hypothetical protein
LNTKHPVRSGAGSGDGSEASKLEGGAAGAAPPPPSSPPPHLSGAGGPLAGVDDRKEEKREASTRSTPNTEHDELLARQLDQELNGEGAI